VGRAGSLSRAVPWAAPFLIYVLAAPLESALGSGRGSLAWSLKLLPAGVALFAARRLIGPRPPASILLGSALLGALGFLFWTFVEAWIPYPHLSARGAFDPLEVAAGQHVFLALRLLALIVVAPLVEELFWRGFLLRFLTDDDFEAVPYGRVGVLAIATTVAFYAASHPEWLAALGYGAGITLWLRRAQNLWAAIVAHVVTNFLLGLYILTTASWGLW
jgi:uncharacterized protein